LETPQASRGFRLFYWNAKKKRSLVYGVDSSIFGDVFQSSRSYLKNGPLYAS
jgi:hypothetical protein